jgi:RND family efflux transporter MFP subunit
MAHILRQLKKLSLLVLAVFAVTMGSASPAQETGAGGERFTVRLETVTDMKAVYATVESADVIAARARIGGTVASLEVDEGDRVEAGQVMAVIVDDRLAPQVRALDAQVTAHASSYRQARAEFDRVTQLLERGVVAQARLDEAQTQLDVAQGQLDAARQERSVVIQQQREGEVLAPTSGTVLSVAVTGGTVVFAGESVAAVASEDYVLRLRLPERHARYLRGGDIVRVDSSALTESVAETGMIRQVYPEIAEGRVIADAEVAGLGAYFVGERVRVWVSAGTREAILIPETFVHSRYGVDFVALRDATGASRDIVVQRGRGEEGGRVEILSGLTAGDVIVAP